MVQDCTREDLVRVVYKGGKSPEYFGIVQECGPKQILVKLSKLDDKGRTQYRNFTRSQIVELVKLS